jgi:hypothetical protein
MQSFLTAGHPDMGDLARCHKGLLKHNINIYNILISHVSRGSTCHFEEGQGPQVVCGPQDVTTIFKDANCLIEVFYFLTKLDCIILQLMGIYNEKWILSLF